VAAILALYVLLPRLAGLDDTWGRIRDGDPVWIVLAVLLEAARMLLATAGAGGIALRPSAALDLEKGGSSPDRRMSEPGVHCYGHADHGRVHLK
jgi:hypothetical protein